MRTTSEENTPNHLRMNVVSIYYDMNSSPSKVSQAEETSKDNEL